MDDQPMDTSVLGMVCSEMLCVGRRVGVHAGKGQGSGRRAKQPRRENGLEGERLHRLRGGPSRAKGSRGQARQRSTQRKTRGPGREVAAGPLEGRGGLCLLWLCTL